MNFFWGLLSTRDFFLHPSRFELHIQVLSFFFFFWHCFSFDVFIAILRILLSLFHHKLLYCAHSSSFSLGPTQFHSTQVERYWNIVVVTLLYILSVHSCVCVFIWHPSVPWQFKCFCVFWVCPLIKLIMFYGTIEVFCLQMF